MPLAKSLIILLIVSVIVISGFSGCIFEDIFGGTSFSVGDAIVFDDDGFPSIIASYTCSDIVYIDFKDPDSNIIDNEFFLGGSGNLEIHLSDYYESVKPGSYQLKVKDKNGDEVFSKSYSYQGQNLVINSCNQKWWKQQFWIGGYKLLGLTLNVENIGDTPCYPYEILVKIDDEEATGRVIPSAILPAETETINCFMNLEIEPTQENYDITILDINGDEIASGTFVNNVVANIPDAQFSWSYNGNRRIYIPRVDFLIDYFESLERYTIEDYAFYVLNPIDDEYFDIFYEAIMFGFTNTNIIGKINYLTSFVQSLDYIADSSSDSSVEYPMYPIETLFNGAGGGDCEDKAILTSALLQKINVINALMRFDNHMAVGVRQPSGVLPDCDYYVDDYYFLETTTEGKTCGFIPSEYEDSADNVILYPVSSRPVLVHSWKDQSILIYRDTPLGDFVKVTCIVTNLGAGTAENLVVEAGFFTQSGLKFNEVTYTIPSLEPGRSKKVILKSDIPESVISVFKTRLILDDEVVDTRESIDYFP